MRLSRFFPCFPFRRKDGFVEFVILEVVRGIRTADDVFQFLRYFIVVVVCTTRKRQ